MISSAKNYTKKKPHKTDRQDPRTNRKSKAIQTKSHITKEKRKKYIYIYHCSQSPPPQFWDDSLSIQVFHRCRVHQVDCGDLICCS